MVNLTDDLITIYNDVSALRKLIKDFADKMFRNLNISLKSVLNLNLNHDI